MDFKQIEAFVNVVKYGSFSKAADASFFSQPTISTHIQNLERELGVKLLDRKGRKVEPTERGISFYKYAVEMINARSGAIEAIKNDSANISGIIDIQSSSIPAVTFLPELMASFRNEHEQVQYVLSVSDTQNVIDNIQDRRGEIGFIGEDIRNSSLDSMLVSSDKSVLIAPLSCNIEKSVRLKDAFEYPFIWRETGSATRGNFEKAVRDAGLDPDSLRISALVDDIDSLVRCVESGLGVSIVSEKVASLISGRVKVAEITGFDERRSFYMIFLKNGSLSPAAAAFTEFIRPE